MNNQDATPIRNYTEVEKRLKGMYKNLAQAQARIVRINNELASIMQSLLINLSEYMDQGEVALWFFSGTPTLENEPYIDWTNVQDHAGDFYYDRSTGTVYQFNGQAWVRLNDDNLVEALAITNADMQDNDNERKLFIDQPVPPYENGDWWIKENGDLYICQIDVEAGTPFNEIDFVPSSLYSLTVASRTANTITVLKGTITEITEDYVKFTDLSTAGSTTIAGENITTGSIISNNYEETAQGVQQGTKLNLNDGTMNTKNFSLDSDGKLTATDAKIYGEIESSSVNITGGKISLVGGTEAIPNFKISDSNGNLTSIIPLRVIIQDNYHSSRDEAILSAGILQLFGDGRSLSNNYVEIMGGSSGGTTSISGGTITTGVVNQTSKATEKKNFEKFENALEAIKNTDIYKYHLKSQKDTDKKHIGFVIGEDFNYSHDITSVDSEGKEIGVDLYSMVSVLWQAVKEQQNEIEKLREGGI